MSALTGRFIVNSKVACVSHTAELFGMLWYLGEIRSTILSVQSSVVL